MQVVTGEEEKTNYLVRSNCASRARAVSISASVAVEKAARTQLLTLLVGEQDCPGIKSTLASTARCLMSAMESFTPNNSNLIERRDERTGAREKEMFVALQLGTEAREHVCSSEMKLSFATRVMKRQIDQRVMRGNR